MSYISAIKEILYGKHNVSNLDIPASKENNKITNLEKRIATNFKLLKMSKFLKGLRIKTLNQLGLNYIFYMS